MKSFLYSLYYWKKKIETINLLRFNRVNCTDTNSVNTDSSLSKTHTKETSTIYERLAQIKRIKSFKPGPCYKRLHFFCALESQLPLLWLFCNHQYQTTPFPERSCGDYLHPPSLHRSRPYLEQIIASRKRRRRRDGQCEGLMILLPAKRWKNIKFVNQIGNLKLQIANSTPLLLSKWSFDEYFFEKPYLARLCADERFVCGQRVLKSTTLPTNVTTSAFFFFLFPFFFFLFFFRRLMNRCLKFHTKVYYISIL